MSEDQKNTKQFDVKKDWHWEDVGGSWIKKVYEDESDAPYEKEAVRYANLLRCSQEVIRCKRDPYLNLVQAMRDLEAAIYACNPSTSAAAITKEPRS